jgi:trimeric autotransporter adhesin
MKYKFIFSTLLFSSTSFAQNVGVGTTTPVERLDVNGNINVTGTIKANGVDGTANQVLMKNNLGALSWGDLCDYKLMATFTNGPGTWTVPAGVTKIVVEAWGAGGGGGNIGGGGGGGYVKARFTVAPGDNISYTIGVGGAGMSSSVGVAGGASTVSVGSYTVTANGGSGGSSNSANVIVALGGQGSVTGAPANLDFMVLTGASGKISMSDFITRGSTIYEHASGGAGGDGANSQHTGSAGRMQFQIAGSPFTIVRVSNTSTAGRPGGGGGSGTSMVVAGTTGIGSDGGPGLVIIHY